MANATKYMRRDAAARYLKDKFGFGSVSSLAKGAVIGDSPVFSKAGAIVLYTPEALDEWALSKISAPRRSTSEDRAGSVRRGRPRKGAAVEAGARA